MFRQYTSPRRPAIALAAVILFTAGACLAEDFGQPNTALLPAAADWEYARGHWEVTTWIRNEDGDFTQAERKAEVKLWYLPDGLTVQSTFRIGDDAFSTQIRTYDPVQEKWTSQFVNAQRQRRAVTESRRIGGEMVTLNVQGYSGTDAFMSREVDTEISADRFVKLIRRSHDMGGTWGPVVFRMEFDRVVE